MPKSFNVIPRFPIYIVSKGRASRCLTSRALEILRVPYNVVVEEQELHQYAEHVDPAKLLVLDKGYQENYDTLDELGGSKSKGPGPARNFAWDGSVAEGHTWHWVMDDNIIGFWCLNNNRKVRFGDASPLVLMENFVLRYENVAMAGPNYFMFASRKSLNRAITLNTRIYSCNLIRNDVGFRWRGRYNEDTELSLRMLKAGWCTVEFNMFLQLKQPTQVMRGGNTDEFYAKEGTEPKSRMLVAMHPDVAKLKWKFGRVHHHVDYGRFKKNKLVRKIGLQPENTIKFKTIKVGSA